MSEAIDRFFLSKQKRSISAVWRQVKNECRKAGVTPPALNTVKKRASALDPRRAAARRGDEGAARALAPAGGVPPPIKAPLQRVQIDHTRVDIVIVDDLTREEIGRPWLTVGIDEFSRCIVGFVLTLESPSATSVGLCLQNMASEKGPWIERLGLRAEWPMAGVPKAIYVDNGSDFHSEAFKRGCEQHSIALSYRPPGKPHFGGIVERLIGTVMRQVHELPGTTFSNPAERGDYESERRAALTLDELTKWFVLAICGVYHASLHTGILEPPARKWARGVKEHGSPRLVPNPEAFLIDFLPVLRRKVGRQGFVIDHVQYFDNSLTPFIANRHQLQSFVVRRDPRDISRIWVLDPETKSYLQIPYRTLSRPGITLWEHRIAREKLRKDGRKSVDEQLIFRTVEEMRSVVDSADRRTKTSRRTKARRQHLTPEPPHQVAFTASPESPSPPIAPFSEIEDW